MLRFLISATCLFSLLQTATAADAALPKLSAPVTCGKLPKVIDESSGLIKSQRYPDKDIFWTHNDSGDTARIFAIDSSGKLLRIVDVPHAENVDWEEITMDERGRIVACDIGDNNRDNNAGKRMGVVLYRFPEPDALNSKEVVPEPEIFRFHYPQGEGPYDAEGVFMRDGNAYLFSKQIEGTTCFKLPMPEKAPAETIAMTVEARTKSFNVVTGAALSPDGMHLALINYITVMVIDLPQPFEKLKPVVNSEAQAGGTPAVRDVGTLPLFSFPRRTVNTFLGQTEAVAWDRDDLVLTTEGGGVFRITKCK